MGKVLVGWACLFAVAAWGTDVDRSRQVVILGVDGMDPALLQQFLHYFSGGIIAAHKTYLRYDAGLFDSLGKLHRLPHVRERPEELLWKVLAQVEAPGKGFLRYIYRLIRSNSVPHRRHFHR